MFFVRFLKTNLNITKDFHSLAFIFLIPAEITSTIGYFLVASLTGYGMVVLKRVVKKTPTTTHPLTSIIVDRQTSVIKPSSVSSNQPNFINTSRCYSTSTSLIATPLHPVAFYSTENATKIHNDFMREAGFFNVRYLLLYPTGVHCQIIYSSQEHFMNHFFKRSYNIETNPLIVTSEGEKSGTMITSPKVPETNTLVPSVYVSNLISQDTLIYPFSSKTVENRFKDSADITTAIEKLKNKDAWYIKDIHEDLKQNFFEHGYFKHILVLEKILPKNLPLNDVVCGTLAVTFLNMYREGYPIELLCFYHRFVIRHVRNREDLEFIISKISQLKKKVNFFQCFSEEIKAILIPEYSMDLNPQYFGKIDEELACAKYNLLCSTIPLQICGPNHTYDGVNFTGQEKPDCFKYLVFSKRNLYYDFKDIRKWFETDTLISPCNHVRITKNEQELESLSVASQKILLVELSKKQKDFSEDNIKVYEISEFKHALEENLKSFQNQTKDLNAFLKDYRMITDKHIEILANYNITTNIPIFISLDDIERSEWKDVENTFIKQFCNLINPDSIDGFTYLAMLKIVEDGKRLPKKEFLIAFLRYIFIELFDPIK